MARARHDSNSASRGNQHVLAIDLHQNFSSEDVKKLLRVLVVMTNLGRSRGHEFLDYCQLLISYQVPSIAIDSPAKMLRVFPADRNGR